MDEIIIRECASIEELDSCVQLQRSVFGLPDLEISPRRHLIVSRQAGGWTLGAFAGSRLVGFVHHLAAIRGSEVFGYSHMMAVAEDYQNKGVGARLKWSQRARALEEGRSLIKWTWDPMQARNAHFNLNRLGVTVDTYAENFYGTDYATNPELQDQLPGIDSDRLFANWRLDSTRVRRLEQRDAQPLSAPPVARIAIPVNWTRLIKEDPLRARDDQHRVRDDFKEYFGKGLICAGFERSNDEPHYLLYSPEAVNESI
jgi:predicted GNAT superfamily acetyltransferase